MIHYRLSTLDDCTVFAPQVREMDRLESLEATGDADMLAHLRFGVEHSKPAHTLLKGDIMLAMFGVVPMSPGVGLVWLLSSDALTKVAKSAAPFAGIWFTARSADYPVMFNYVHPKNTAAHRWLRWFDFTFPGVTHPNGHLLFVRTSKCATQ